MRQVLSDQLSDFAAIYDENVEIVSVKRAQAKECEVLSKRLIKSRQVPELRWIQPIDDPDASVRALPTRIDGDVRSAILAQIIEASELLGELIECDRVGIRLETLNAPMCPRFHVDQIPCRMLITLRGVGTEWIPNPDVDWNVFDDLDSEELPAQTDRQIQRLSTGNWSLLKGGGWQDHFRGVVHRSPHNVGERLLLALDPLVEPAEVN
ncbi:MAG: DUF1826 domain-containing protein [Gammaproteobacteria bacterium]|nr:DUF1826 domain-containing protein [Gammaproteobacteria bacterium]